MNDEVLHQICRRVLSCHSLVLSSSLQSALDQELAEHRISQKLRTYGLFLLMCLERHPHLAAYFLKELKAPNIATVCAEACVWTLDAYPDHEPLGPPPPPLRSLLEIYPEGLPAVTRVLCKRERLEWALHCVENPVCVAWNNQEQFAHDEIVNQAPTWGIASNQLFTLLTHPCVFEKLHPRHLYSVVFHMLCHENLGFSQQEIQSWMDRLLIKFKLFNWMKSYELLLFNDLLSSPHPDVLDCAAHFFSHPLWSDEQKSSLIFCWMESHASSTTHASLHAAISSSISPSVRERRILEHLSYQHWAQCDVWLQQMSSEEQMDVLGKWLKKHVEASSILPQVVEKMHLSAQLFKLDTANDDQGSSSGRRKM